MITSLHKKQQVGGYKETVQKQNSSATQRSQLERLILDSEVTSKGPLLCSASFGQDKQAVVFVFFLSGAAQLLIIERNFDCASVLSHMVL